MCKSTGAFGLAAILIAVLSAAPFDGAQAKFTVLHSFTISNDGPGYPYAGLLRDSAGNLYGTTEISGAGTVFRLAPDGTFQVLHAFDGQDGAYPLASLIADGAGNLYGTTQIGGASDFGVVFKLAPDGTYTVLHSFAGGPSDGGNPQAVTGASARLGFDPRGQVAKTGGNEEPAALVVYNM